MPPYLPCDVSCHNLRVTGRCCRTDLPPNTAFRVFGGLQAVLAIEYVMDRVAAFLAIDGALVRDEHGGCLI